MSHESLPAPRHRFRAALLVLLLAACAVRPAAGPPPAPEALEAMESAWELGREAELADAVGDRPAMREALERAVRAAPDWIAPQRELDQLDLVALRGPAVWLRRQAAVEADPDDPAALYLLGRLEGEGGTARFRRALGLDAGLAWAHHALSVDHELRGRSGAALESEREALRLARDPFARGQFATRASTLAARTGDDEGAREVLADALVDTGGAAGQAATLRLARLELQSGDRFTVERGFRRALALFRERPLTDGESASLLSATQRATRGRSRDAFDLEVIEALLEGHRPPGIEQGAAALAGRDPLTLQFELQRDDSPATPRSDLRSAFRVGDYAGGGAAWLAAQPTVVLDSAGLPRDPVLRAVFEAAAEASSDDPPSELRLCAALLDAGWADVAQALLGTLGAAARDGRADAEAVAELDRRARAVEALVGEVDTLVGALFDGSDAWVLTPFDPESEDGDRPSRPDDLDGVLGAVQGLFERYGEAAGLEAELYADLEGSPRIRYGPFGAVVAPGPFHGARDAELGLGEAGEAVPGLAAVAARLGRLALFGDAIGRDPDGTLLLRLWAEERSGTHLGAPWSGVIIWCGGAEANGARSRGAGEVSGAALHEGYWIDVEAERGRLERWRVLGERFFAGDEDADQILDQPVAELPARLEGEERRAERRRLIPPLGQGSRVALALLAERRAARPGTALDELITLDDMLEVVQVHEEGHLCDRERFLPFGRNLGSLLLLALREVVGELGIERRAEYRAQAVALACVSEPRLPLIDLLDSAEVDTRNFTVHALAYRRLLEDFLRELERMLHAEPEAWPQLDGGRYLVHQLHRLDPEQVRRVAVEVARREGLVEEG